MLFIKGITKYFDDNLVIDNLNLNIEKGVTGIFGDKKSGKSTLLKLLSGFLKPENGKILFNKINISSTDSEATQKIIGYSPKNVSLFEHLSGHQNLEYIGATKYGKPNLYLKLIPILKSSGVYNEPNETIEFYDNDTAKMLQLIASFIGNPPLIIWDEPFLSLRESYQSSLRRIIKERQSSFESLIFTAQSADKYLDLCDHTIILSGGKIISEHKPLF